MTRKAISLEFEDAVEHTSNDQLSELTTLVVDERFAAEAGLEFTTAVAVVGLHRVLI
jgi:hypothetical protein